MAVKKRSTAPPKRPAPGSARGKQSPAIGRALVKDALESWVVPVVALASAALFWLLSAIDVWPEPVAVVGVAVSLLVLALFAALRPYLFAENPRHRQVAAGFAALWAALLFTSFYRHNFPGEPLAAGTLRAGGDAIAVPVGLDAVVTDGHFIAQQSQGNRLGHYHLEIVPASGPSVPIDGNFEDSFARQRLGRRGSTTVEIQHTSQRHVVSVPAESRLRVTELDSSLDPELRVAVYRAANPWLFPILGAVGIVVALVLEKWLDGDGSATMAAAVTFFVVDQYLRWASPHPQLRSLIGAILVGGFIGAPLAALLWRLVPRRWIVQHR
jgi:hypothetical protein